LESKINNKAHSFEWVSLFEEKHYDKMVGNNSNGLYIDCLWEPVLR